MVRTRTCANNTFTGPYHSAPCVRTYIAQSRVRKIIFVHSKAHTHTHMHARRPSRLQESFLFAPLDPPVEVP